MDSTRSVIKMDKEMDNFHLHFLPASAKTKVFFRFGLKWNLWTNLYKKDSHVYNTYLLYNGLLDVYVVFRRYKLPLKSIHLLTNHIPPNLCSRTPREILSVHEICLCPEIFRLQEIHICIFGLLVFELWSLCEKRAYMSQINVQHGNDN